jgi:hypothetical protein
MADITTWTPITAPTDFRDDAVFDIDFRTKTVQVLVEQPIVAGENLSQFIKFQAPRYYDNIDLTNMSVNILFISPAGNTGISAAVNTEYSDDMIRCGWLVPYAACPVKGTLLFVLEFVGADYTLKTTIASTPVLDSINDADVVPEPVEQAWYITLQANVSAALQEAQTALGRIESIFNALSTPLSADTVADMTEESAIYVYTGSETGYTYGNWYYYDGTEWVSGGTYASTALVTDRTLSRRGQPADAEATRQAIAAEEARAKAEEERIEALFTQPVEEAVGEWLDEHPEATTTVQDGSLTEAKFTPALKLATVKDYVTPEMFGAVGDGVTDDTQAVQDALDSGTKCVRFGTKTYMCSGVVVSSAITLEFSDTTFTATTLYQQYILKVEAFVTTTGRASFLGVNKALYGVWIASGSGKSDFSYLRVLNCLVWGVYLDESLLLNLGYVSISGCGMKDTFTITRASDTTFTLDTGSARNKYVFENHIQSAFVVDMSGYGIGWHGSSIPWKRVWIADSFTGDENANTGTVTLKSGSHNKMESGYNGEKSVYVLIGGGIGWKVSQGGACSIDFLNSLNNAVGIAINGTNRNLIKYMYSQGDRIPIVCANYNIGTVIDQFGLEGPETGMAIYVYSYAYLIINSREDWSCDPSKIGNNAGYDEIHNTVVFAHNAAKRISTNVSNTATSSVVVNELFNNESFYRAITTIKLSLLNIGSNVDPRNEYEGFGIKTIYMGKIGQTYNASVKITMDSALISAGYTIKGATDNVLTVDCTNDTFFTIKIIKVGSVFLVSKEAHNVIT